MIRASNYASSRFRGILTFGIGVGNLPPGVTTQARFVPMIDTTHCQEIVFGPQRGCVREVDVLVDLGPGERFDLRIDQIQAAGTATVDIGDAARFGRPALDIGGVITPLPHAGGEVAGRKIRSKFAGRVGQPFYELWVEFDPASGWGRWECLTTPANPSFANPRCEFPAEVKLVWLDAEAVVLRSGMDQPVLFTAGDFMAQGQARALCGVVGWTRLMSVDAYSSLVAAGQDAVVAVDSELPAPIGMARPGLATRAPSPLAWANQFFGPARDTLPGWERIWNLGWAPASTSTGDQEDQGYAKGGQALAEPGAARVDYYTACAWARKPCHWLEPDGSMLSLARFPALKMLAGQPHWHRGVSPDWLGMERLPTQLESHGHYGPDQSHWFCNRLWSATSATCSPMLMRLCEHQAQLIEFSVTLNPAWSTTTTGESRAMGWQCLVMANLIRVLPEGSRRTAVLQRACDWLQFIVVPWLTRPAGAQQILYDYPITDGRGSISQEYLSDGTTRRYPEWWSVWQQGVGSFGLWVLATMPEVVAVRPQVAEDARVIAVRAGRLVVDAGITGDPANPKVWDTLGIRSDGQPLDRMDMIEGVGAHSTGWFANSWVPLGVWVAAKDGHERARAIYRTMYDSQLAGTSDMDWFPPPQW